MDVLISYGPGGKVLQCSHSPSLTISSTSQTHYSIRLCEEGVNKVAFINLIHRAYDPGHLPHPSDDFPCCSGEHLLFDSANDYFRQIIGDVLVRYHHVSQATQETVPPPFVVCRWELHTEIPTGGIKFLYIICCKDGAYDLELHTRFRAPGASLLRTVIRLSPNKSFGSLIKLDSKPPLSPALFLQ
jgi:hypothetical protein